MYTKTLTIGLFGFGVVGQGLYDILCARQLPGIRIKKICIRDAGKARSLPADRFTTDHEELLGDPEINTIVELINDTGAAFRIVSRALASGKNVVSASKHMIALHLPELLELQHRHGTSLLYEGAVCGSIPVIRNLEEYYDNELLHSVSGIFNGSSNFILTKMTSAGMDYATALRQAQVLGFAETDPTMDVGGFDAKFKLAIIAAHAYGLPVSPEKILNTGIQNLSEHDLRYAREKGKRIKLVPVARELDDRHLVMFVLPKLVGPDEFLYNVDNEYNGVVVQAAFADQQFFYGKGAGGHPTGAAVLSDITALRYGYRYEYKKHQGGNPLQLTAEVVLPVYFRFTLPQQQAELEFESISEYHRSADYCYVTGEIRLDTLIRHRALLDQPGVFIALNGSLADIRAAHSVPDHNERSINAPEPITS